MSTTLFVDNDPTMREVAESILGAGGHTAGIKVVSGRPEWVELLIPCELADVPPLEQLVTQLDASLPLEVRESIADAFREMLNNAIEHGCKLDPTKQVQVRYVRFDRAIVCWIKDPGEGFDPARLEHAAVSNPTDDPVRHLFVREEKGLRPGGFGILMASQMVDELIYNESHNELMFIKYIGVNRPYIAAEGSVDAHQRRLLP